MAYFVYVPIIVIFFWLILREVAPKTKWDWDDDVLNVVEGLIEQAGYDPDALAKKARGKLKKRLQEKGKINPPM